MQKPPFKPVTDPFQPAPLQSTQPDLPIDDVVPPPQPLVDPKPKRDQTGRFEPGDINFGDTDEDAGNTNEE